MTGSGNGFCLGCRAITTGKQLGAGGSTGSDSGYASAIPCVVYSIFVLTPITVTGMLGSACRSVGKDVILLIDKFTPAASSSVLVCRILAERIGVTLCLICISTNAITPVLVVVAEGRVSKAVVYILCF